MQTLEAIDRDLAELEAKYQRDKATLLKIRDLVLQLNGGPPPRASTTRQAWTMRGESSRRAPIRDRRDPIEEIQNEPRTKSDTMRAILLQLDGPFTLRDLEEATMRSPFKLASKLSKQDWTSRVWQFYKQGLVELVSERKGNLPGVYRLKTKDLNPSTPRTSQFPLQEMVISALKAMKQPQFGRNDVYHKVIEMNPAFKDRITLASVSALLNRVSRFENSPVKRLKSGIGSGGNIYTKADNSS